VGPFVLAWLAGEGIIVYRTVSKDHLPPSPGRLLASSGFFALLAIIAKMGPGAQRAATLMAFGLDIAAILQAPLTNAGSTGGSGAKFPAAGSAGSSAIIPDGGPNGALACQDASTGSSSSSGGTSTGGASGGGSAAANQQVAQQVIAANPAFAGWGSGQNWTDLVNLWNKESGWSTSATNSSSGAYGIAQALGHGSSGTASGSTNEYGGYGLTSQQAQQANSGSAADQILWGLNYILQTYGSPAAAWAHETADNWY